MLDDRVMQPFSLHQLTFAAHLELKLHQQEEDHPRQVHLLPIQDHLDVNLQVEAQVEVVAQVESMYLHRTVVVAGAQMAVTVDIQGVADMKGVQEAALEVDVMTVVEVTGIEVEVGLAIVAEAVLEVARVKVVAGAIDQAIV